MKYLLLTMILLTGCVHQDLRTPTPAPVESTAHKTPPAPSIAPEDVTDANAHAIADQLLREVQSTPSR